VSGVVRRGLQGLGDDLLHLLVVDPAGSTGTRFVEQASRTVLDEAGAPLPDHVLADPQFFGDPEVGQAIGASQHDAGAQSQRLRGLGSGNQPRKELAVVVGDGERSHGPAARHNVDLIVRPDGDRTIIHVTSVPGH